MAKIYPRCKSLGLIEACPLSTKAFVAIWHIRGVKASASLKPRILERGFILPHYIRGVKASASLKPGEKHLQHEMGEAAYPRCKSLGLIEAAGSGGDLPGRGAIIRGFKPRPH